MFKESGDSEPIDKKVIYLDEGNVLGVIPKTKGFDNAFKGVFESEKKETDLTEMLEDGDYQESKFGSEYFKIIAQILGTLDEEVTLKVKKDNPLIIETQHFKLVLAPRVDYED